MGGAHLRRGLQSKEGMRRCSNPSILWFLIFHILNLLLSLTHFFCSLNIPCTLPPPYFGTKRFPPTRMPFASLPASQGIFHFAKPSCSAKTIYSHSTLFSYYRICKAGWPYHSYLGKLLPSSLGCEGCWHGVLSRYASQDSKTHSRSFACLSCAQRCSGCWGSSSEKNAPL